MRRPRPPRKKRSDANSACLNLTTQENKKDAVIYDKNTMTVKGKEECVVDVPVNQVTVDGEVVHAVPVMGGTSAPADEDYDEGKQVVIVSSPLLKP